MSALIDGRDGVLFDSQPQAQRFLERCRYHFVAKQIAQYPPARLSGLLEDNPHAELGSRCRPWGLYTFACLFVLGRNGSCTRKLLGQNHR